MSEQNPFEILAGSWIYRSFRNLTTPVNSLEEILFGEGDLYLPVPADGLFTTGKLSFGADFPMVVQGQASVLPHNVSALPPLLLEMKAFGVEGTNTASWVYEHRGYLIPTWPNGVEQRTALVGTVIRVVPHGANSKAGVVASFVAVKLTA